MNRPVVLILLVLTAASGWAHAQDRLPPDIRDVGLDQRLGELVPLDAEFRDEAGEAVRLGDYFDGKPVILVLAYYRCPMLCNQVLSGLADSLREITFDAGDQFRVVTVSFDATEQPALAAAKKATYVEHYGRPGAEGGWHFLTGPQESIDRLTRAVGFHYAYDPAQDQFAHASGITVLTPNGKIARCFYGIQYPPRDLRLGLVEASEERIGSPVDRVLLLCYHYDGTTGKYSLAVMGLVRMSGALTLVVLGTLLGRGWYRDWRKERTRLAKGE
jgi:protein SCO1/2